MVRLFLMALATVLLCTSNAAAERYDDRAMGISMDVIALVIFVCVFLFNVIYGG